MAADMKGGKKPKGNRPLKLKAAGCELTVKTPSADGIQAFLDAMGNAMKKLVKEGLPLEVLPSLMSMKS